MDKEGNIDVSLFCCFEFDRPALLGIKTVTSSGILLQ